MPRLCSGLLLSLVIASSGSAVTMSWSPVGGAGNACDPQSQGCFGAVGYAYDIGTYEVTNAQYAEFLNAKAKSDPFILYNPNMGNELPDFAGFGGIQRSGSAGSYVYTPIAGREDLPVNWVSYYDSLRFANWMNNGQGNADTESGAYTLLPATGLNPSIPGNSNTVVRNPGAAIVLASENEWYKAAYYDVASTTYFDYPADTNSPTECSGPTSAPNSANCSEQAPGDPEDMLPVGSYPGSASPNGTFDQGGNVFEWNEAITGVLRIYRGGAHNLTAALLNGSSRSTNGGALESVHVGLRLVLIPEPGTGLLFAVGLLGFAGWRRVRASNAPTSPSP